MPDYTPAYIVLGMLVTMYVAIGVALYRWGKKMDKEWDDSFMDYKNYIQQMTNAYKKDK